tara:strand:- start:77433 stop:78395 length:963 start_codon:yes stop_codon:yes gene_type:complete
VNGYSISKRYFGMIALSACSTAAMGQGLGIPLSVAITPNLFDSELTVSESDRLTEARLKSGLGLSLKNTAFEFDADYLLQSRMHANSAASDNPLSQHFNASLQSSALNRWLGIDLGVKANTLLKAGGDSYRSRLTPGFSTSLIGLATLRVNYEVELDRPLARQIETRKEGYSMSLEGALQQGRLSWSGTYRNFDLSDADVAVAQSTEVFAFKSRYRFNEAMHIELSSTLRYDTHTTHSSADSYTDRLLGTSVSFAPSTEYAVAIKIKSHDQPELQRQERFGSGSISWFPRRGLELTFDYGDQLIEGDAGWMVHTRLDFNG